MDTIANKVILDLEKYLELYEFKKNIMNGQKYVTSNSMFGGFTKFYTDSEIVKDLIEQLNSFKKMDNDEFRKWKKENE